VETFLYRVLAGIPYGQLRVIVSHHLSDSNTALKAMSFWGLFARYSPKYLPWYWGVFFLLFALAAVYALWRMKNAPVRALILLSLSYLLGMSFEVKSLNPVIPAEPFIHRYFTPVLATACPVIGLAAAQLLGRLRSRLRERSSGWRWFLSAPAGMKYGGLLALCLAVITAVFASGLLPPSASLYFNDPFEPKTHPLYLNSRYRESVNRAFSQGMPIVSPAGIAGTNSLETCTHFFLDGRFFERGKPPRLRALNLYGREYLFVLGPAHEATAAAVFADPQARVLLALRNPFRVRELSVAELESLLVNEGSDKEL